MNDGGSPAFAIQTSAVVKTFDHGVVRALDGVDLSVRRGEWVAVAGPSGCGKSTLLHLLAALDLPTSGVVAVNGRDTRTVRDLNRFRREEVGLVFQLHNLIPTLTALQNIEVAMLGSGRGRRERRERARRLLDEVGLADKAHVTPPRLSVGTRQRVAIARALANEPRILLADEPTGSLDSASVANVLALLRRIREERGVTIVLVTHDMQVAAVADRIVTMRDGRIVDEGSAPPLRPA
jgi:putative ABC transport system ATP-binding protein